MTPLEHINYVNLLVLYSWQTPHQQLAKNSGLDRPLV